MTAQPTPDASPSRPLDDPAVAAAHTAGVLRRRHACQLYGEGRVRAQLQARRWQEPAHEVIVCHNGPLTDEQRTWAALLAGPPGSMLFGLSAASYDGLQGLEPDHLSIVVPGSSQHPRRHRLVVPDECVQVKWSTKLGPEDVSPVAIPPRTRLPRSIVDAASEKVPERRSRVIVLAAVQQRLVRTPALWDALSRRGRCRNRAIIAESILDAAGGSTRCRSGTST